MTWRDETERLQFEYAAEECKQFRDEPLSKHLARIAEMAMAAKLAPPVKEMPSVRLPYKDADDVLQRLREQADEITAKRTA